MPISPKASSQLHSVVQKEADLPLENRDASPELIADEADALFGKRSEVRDAHDRYSNQSDASLPHKP